MRCGASTPAQFGIAPRSSRAIAQSARACTRANSRDADSGRRPFSMPRRVSRIERWHIRVQETPKCTISVLAPHRWPKNRVMYDFSQRFSKAQRSPWQNRRSEGLSVFANANLLGKIVQKSEKWSAQARKWSKSYKSPVFGHADRLRNPSHHGLGNPSSSCR